MKLKFDTLKDKINGCWQGKNAGGVLGAPFECRRGLFDITWYTQKDIDRNPPPNDDLDLQIAWLNAVEEYGRLSARPSWANIGLPILRPTGRNTA